MSSDWAARLQEMEQWYRDLLGAGDLRAEAALLADYEPHAGFFGSLTGRILDVGGGAGLTSRYLRADSDYWVIDPANVWNEVDWKEFGGLFSSTGPKPHFLNGTGENLPFGDGEFDAVLAMWSLNHAQDPRRCVEEMTRVLRSGGAMLLVLEDMPPSWGDVARLARQRIKNHLGLRTAFLDWNQKEVSGLKATIQHRLSRQRWPLQSDHIRVDEDLLYRQVGLRPCRREWVGGFLTLEARKW